MVQKLTEVFPPTDVDGTPVLKDVIPFTESREAEPDLGGPKTALKNCFGTEELL